MVTAALQRLAPVARTVAWPALLTGVLTCVALVVVAPLAPGSSPLAHWPGFGALALCVGAAFLLDDAAGATVGASPRSLARRRLLRVALALPLLCTAWAGSLWYATAADAAWFGPDTRAALTLQFAAMLTVTLASSAIALRVAPDEHGGWTGALAPFAILTAALVLPDRWALLAAPGDDAWSAAQPRWAALLALGLLTLMWANRDPASRSRRWRTRSVAAPARECYATTTGAQQSGSAVTGPARTRLLVLAPCRSRASAHANPTATPTTAHPAPEGCPLPMLPAPSPAAGPAPNRSSTVA